jgi:hypothetical protein
MLFVILAVSTLTIVVQLFNLIGDSERTLFPIFALLLVAASALVFHEAIDGRQFSNRVMSGNNAYQGRISEISSNVLVNQGLPTLIVGTSQHDLVAAVATFEYIRLQTNLKKADFLVLNQTGYTLMYHFGLNQDLLRTSIKTFEESEKYRCVWISDMQVYFDRCQSNYRVFK